MFNVAGIIRLKSPLIIRAPYITIACQSAPGDGVCVAGEPVWINTHDLVIRYLRYRRGSTEVTRRDDALGGNGVGNIMIDHVSASWGLDENMSMWNRSADGGDNKSFYSFINNYYKPGSINPKDRPIGYRILKPEAGRDKNDTSHYGKAYISGNIVEGNDKVTKDNWAGGVQIEDMPDAGKFTKDIRVNTKLPMAKVTIMPTMESYQYVLENAGATLPKRDPVDTRIIEEVRTGKITYKENGKTNIDNKFIKRRLPEDSYK